jgi:archaellum biogenesis ATPase FlaH
MSARGEKVLIQHLPNEESLTTIAREGLPSFILPTEELRPVYDWALKRFFRSGRKEAASVEAIKAEWGDLLNDHDIDIEEAPEDAIEWAIDDLKGGWVYLKVQTFNKELGQAIAEATADERVSVASHYSQELISMVMDMESKEDNVDVREGFDLRLKAYQERLEDQEHIYGLRFGLPDIDNFTRGIHPGELAIVAAGPKVGKSWLCALTALREWEAGSSVVLYTLENSVDMTLDRMACLAQNVEYRNWQHGNLVEGEYERVREWVESVKDRDTPLRVIQPEPGQRSVEQLVQQAQLMDADSLIIDQLTFLEPPDERAPRHIQIREITHRLHTMISTGRKKMPCLMAHQINREGVKAAAKVGYLEMYHLAEGSEVERTADWVFGIHRTHEEVLTLKAKFQVLGARRERQDHGWHLRWSIDTGFVGVLGPWSPDRNEM